MSIVGFLIVLFLGCLAYWAATRIMAAFGVGEPIRTVVIVALVVILVLWLLQMAGFGVPGLR